MVLWVLKKETDQFVKENEANEVIVFRYHFIAERKKRSINTTMSIASAMYVVLRLPIFVVASLDAKEEGTDFAWDYRAPFLGD